jgi:hypothetical protein
MQAHLQLLLWAFIGRSGGQVGYHEGDGYQNRHFCALLAGSASAALRAR